MNHETHSYRSSLQEASPTIGPYGNTKAGKLSLISSKLKCNAVSYS